MEDLNSRSGIRAGRVTLFLALLLMAPGMARADKLVFKDGKTAFGTITDEKDSLIKYFDRFERPRKTVASLVDTIHYDSKGVRGLVKVAFRKGQPKDRSGYFRIRHSEELDLDVEYRTDSIAELDLFFRNNVHVRVLANSHFKVSKAPRSQKDPLVLELFSGRVMATGSHDGALIHLVTPGGIAVGRGIFQAGAAASSKDSSLQVMCLRGLAGIQETPDSPGELVVEAAKSVGIYKREGVFNRMAPDPDEEARFLKLAANMGRYRFSAVAYPKIGYLPKAITGLGFMVFFYGTAIGILDYVNHI